MEKIKEIQKRQWELNLQKNEFWQNELTDYFQNSEDPNEMMNYINLVNDLSVNDIKNAANEYLGENLVQIILFPESGNDR